MSSWRINALVCFVLGVGGCKPKNSDMRSERRPEARKGILTNGLGREKGPSEAPFNNDLEDEGEDDESYTPYADSENDGMVQSDLSVIKLKLFSNEQLRIDLPDYRSVNADGLGTYPSYSGIYLTSSGEATSQTNTASATEVVATTNVKSSTGTGTETGTDTTITSEKASCSFLQDSDKATSYWEIELVFLPNFQPTVTAPTDVRKVYRTLGGCVFNVAFSEILTDPSQYAVSAEVSFVSSGSKTQVYTGSPN